MGASVSGVLALSLAFLLGSLFPHAEDPWPDTIGIGFPFAAAGAGVVLAGVLFADAPKQRRDRWTRRLGQSGFYAGAVLYVLSLAIQVVSR